MSHLEHLQSILLNFNSVAVPTKITMVRYFEEDLKLSIKAEMDQNNSQLIDYEELIVKAVKAEAKAGLRLSVYVQKTDLSCLRGNQPAHTTAHKVQTQGAVNCGDDSKASKGLASTLASASTQDPEPSDKAWKNKKKKQHRDKRDFREFRNIPASEVNMTEVRDKKRRKKRKVPKKVTYYNCNKLGHYGNQCLEPWKLKN